MTLVTKDAFLNRLKFNAFSRHWFEAVFCDGGDLHIYLNGNSGGKSIQVCLASPYFDDLYKGGTPSYLGVSCSIELASSLAALLKIINTGRDYSDKAIPYWERHTHPGQYDFDAMVKFVKKVSPHLLGKSICEIDKVKWMAKCSL